MAKHLLILPRLRIQNANCISSSLTWGFPAITAFTGMMVALARQLKRQALSTHDLHFESVGVVCHHFEAQVSEGGYTRSFRLSRNPLLQNGSTAAIVQEGRAHLDISLMFCLEVEGYLSDEERQALAYSIATQVAGMRIAGGSVMPPLKRVSPPRLIKLEVDGERRAKQFKNLRRSLLPGFALVSRDDLLQKHRHELQTEKAANAPEPTLLDAWLDLSRLNYRATQDAQGKVTWLLDKRPGWLVPIPVGYVALSELHAAGTVANARDTGTPFRFVESVYSIGQWVSPHRVNDVSHLLWHSQYDPKLGLYRCVNQYAPREEEDTEPESPISEVHIPD